jgi:hypothetical protein
VLEVESLNQLLFVNTPCSSEKAPRMFATLVVALPSKHEGGEVRVTHAGKTEVFETSKFSAFDFSYLAW